MCPVFTLYVFMLAYVNDYKKMMREQSRIKMRVVADIDIIFDDILLYKIRQLMNNY